MTLGEFVAAYNGKLVDFDGYYGPQCADLVQFYARDVLGAPKFAGANAVNFFGEHPDFYDWTKRTPTNFPARGDIIVWDGSFGKGAGHTAIDLNANKNTFDSLDQNWGPTVTHIVTHVYLGVIGWGHPKGVLKMEDDVKQAFQNLRNTQRKTTVALAALQLGIPLTDAELDGVWPQVHDDFSNVQSVLLSLRHSKP